MRFCGVDLCGVHPALSIEKEYPPGMPDRDVYTIAGRDGETAVGYAVVQGEYKVNVNIAARRREEGWRIRGLLAAWAMASFFWLCDVGMRSPIVCVATII